MTFDLDIELDAENWQPVTILCFVLWWLAVKVVLPPRSWSRWLLCAWYIFPICAVYQMKICDPVYQINATIIRNIHNHYHHLPNNWTGAM